MKRFLLTIVMLAAAAGAATAQVAVGAGYLNSTATTKAVNSTDVTFDGFYAGASYGIPLSMGLGVAPGLYYSYLKTGDGLVISDNLSGGIDQAQQFISVPVYLYYGTEATPELRLSIYGGPALEYCFSYKTIFRASAFGAKIEKEEDNFETDPNNKHFDILIGGGVALDVAGILRVSCGYNFGLLDKYANAGGDDGITVTRRGLNVGLAFLF